MELDGSPEGSDERALNEKTAEMAKPRERTSY
jgi:hypothetical protein